MSSPPHRFELRVSNLLKVVLALLAALAAVALWRSELPRASLVLAPGLFAFAWWQARRLPWRELVLRGDGSAAAVDATGETVELVPVLLQRRGPLWVLRVTARGRMRSLLFGPDTLDAKQRRQMRLWMERHVLAATATGDAAHV